MSRALASAAGLARALVGRGAVRASSYMSSSAVVGLTTMGGAIPAPAVVAPASGMGRGFAASAFASKGVAAPAAKSASRTWKAPTDQEQSGRGVQHDLVKKYLSEECMSSSDLNVIAKCKVGVEYARHELDCGSSEVQVATLTTKIQYLIKHLLVHRKDHSSKRGLQMMLERRRKLLKYLRRTNGDQYGALIFKLGLRDNVVSKAKDYS